MTRKKISEKSKGSPEKASRRTSRRGRKSTTASPERGDDASSKDRPEEHPEGQQKAEEHKSDDSDSDQEEEELRKRSRARRGSRAKASEEKTIPRPRRSSRRKSQSVEPSDKEESGREENGEHAAEKDTAAMDTIPEENAEDVQETTVARTPEPEPVEKPKKQETKAEPEPEIAEQNNHEEEDRELDSEQKDLKEGKPDEPQDVEFTKADICDQSRESGEVDSESVQEDESQQTPPPPPSKTEEAPKEASPEKEASEEESTSEKENRKSEIPKRVRKSRFRSRSKSPERIEPISDSANTKPTNDGDDKNDDELEAGEIKDDEVIPKRSPEKKLTEEKLLRRPLQRKRRWLSSKTDTKASVITISTDSLKNIISEPVKPVPLSDVKLESSPEPEEIVDSNEEQSSGERRRSKDKLSVKSSEKENNIEEAEYKPKPVDKLLGNRKISIVSDDATAAIARPPSPARHHSSNILYITNLVRPFTVLQLKSLLARTGKIVENGFWIDKIKSKCYVKYETEDEAVETRHALHGVRWPASNPKYLHVDFGTESAMEKAIISTLDDAGTTRITIDNTKDAKDFGWSRDAKHDEIRPVREWDLGKKDTFDREDRDRGADGDRIGRDRDRERERDRDRDRERDRDRSGRGDEGRGDRGRRRSSEREFGRGDRDRRRGSPSVSPARKFKKKENEPPIRLLDDLFRKTKTTPCIYWLPLTIEQMAVKEEQRRKELVENQRRQEETRKQEEERRKERERRDRERRERPRSNSRDRRRRSRSRDDGRRRHR